MKKIKNWNTEFFRGMLALIGLALIGINIWGWFTPLRSTGLGLDFPYEVSFAEKQLPLIAHQNFTDRTIYLREMNDAVHKGIVNYWGDAGIDRYHLRIPLDENYVLFLASFIYPHLFEKYEFNNYQKAAVRGIGLCSEQAIILTQLLDNRGIPARIVGLDGHVVVTAQADPENDQWWILDPDYGVVIDKDLAFIEGNPAVVRKYYSDAGYSDITTRNIVSYFGKDGNYVTGENGSIIYHPTRYVMIFVEDLAYVIKWLLPILLIAPFVVSKFWPRKVTSEEK